MKRWNAIRDIFAQAVEKKLKRSGDEADNSRTCPYFDQLLFLKHFIKNKE